MRTGPESNRQNGPRSDQRSAASRAGRVARRVTRGCGRAAWSSRRTPREPQDGWLLHPQTGRERLPGTGPGTPSRPRPGVAHALSAGPASQFPAAKNAAGSRAATLALPRVSASTRGNKGPLRTLWQRPFCSALIVASAHREGGRDSPGSLRVSLPPHPGFMRCPPGVRDRRNCGAEHGTPSVRSPTRRGRRGRTTTWRRAPAHPVPAKPGTKPGTEVHRRRAPPDRRFRASLCVRRTHPARQ